MNEKLSHITTKNLPALKRAYNKAVKHKQEVFVFRGTELVTGYAKYLIEYLESLTKS